MVSTCWLMRKPFFDPLVTVTGGPVKLALNHLNVDKNHGLHVTCSNHLQQSLAASGSKIRFRNIEWIRSELYFSKCSFSGDFFLVPMKFCTFI